MNSNPLIANAVGPLAEHLVPPAGILSKFPFYSKRYGCFHALCSYIGRRYLRFWKLVGPSVTRSYLQKWLMSPGPHVLNLGGGGALSKRWLTADVTSRADVFMNITKALPLPDGIIDIVYSEEVIEHVDREAGRRMLAECFRVLKPGGTLRLTTPSLNYFAKQALSDPAAAQQVNDIFYCHGHRFIYSEEYLRQVLSELGFQSIRPSSYRDPKSKYGAFDSHPARFAFAPAEWSQYWEAEKPSINS